MKNLITSRLAGNILIVSLSLLLVFHVLVLLRVVPAEIVWGGQAMTSPSDLLMLEGFAFIITLVFLAVVSAKVGYIRANNFIKVVNVFLWIILVYLFLNLGANLISRNLVENLLFAPVTLILGLLVYRLILEN